MKKILMALMAVAAIVLSSCTHKTCTLNVINEYNEKALVLFSEDAQCSTPEEATLFAAVEPGQAASQKNVKLDNLYGVIYLSTGVKDADDNEQYKRVDAINLSEYAGSAVVTVTITPNGLYGINASNM